MERRQFLKSLSVVAAYSAARSFSSVERLFASERLGESLEYGFTRSRVLARREVNEAADYFDTYDHGALLRYQHLVDRPGWVKIAHDSWRTRRWENLAHGDIYIPRNLLESLDPQAFIPSRADLPAKQKRIEVCLKEPQYMAAFEGENLVMATTVSAGLRDLTPTGTRFIYKKQLSRHMQSLPSLGTWDHPGVGFVQYFGSRGEAFHSAYWHNSFGQPKSSGCINLRRNDAQWLWRWGLTKRYQADTESIKIDVDDRIRVEISYEPTTQIDDLGVLLSRKSVAERAGFEPA